MSEQFKAFIPDLAHEPLQSEKTPNQIKLREMLNQIDEGKLRDIFFTFFTLTGQDETDFNYIPVRKVVTADDDVMKAAGEYHSETKQIILNAKLLCNNLTAVLHTYIHEQLHAIRDYKGTDEALSEFTEEGLTELIANDIYDAYLGTQSGSSGAAEYFYKNRQENPYGNNQKALDFYIELLGILSNQHSQHIRNELYKAYVKRETIIPPQTRMTLDEIAPQFGKKISDLLEYGPSFELVQTIVSDIKNSTELSAEEIVQIMNIIKKISQEDRFVKKTQ